MTKDTLIYGYIYSLANTYLGEWVTKTDYGQGNYMVRKLFLIFFYTSLLYEFCDEYALVY